MEVVGTKMHFGIHNVVKGNWEFVPEPQTKQLYRNQDLCMSQKSSSDLHPTKQFPFEKARGILGSFEAEH